MSGDINKEEVFEKTIIRAEHTTDLICSMLYREIDKLWKTYEDNHMCPIYFLWTYLIQDLRNMGWSKEELLNELETFSKIYDDKLKKENLKKIKTKV